MHRYMLIAIGGALGAMLRYFIGQIAAEHFGPRFPVGTLTINLSACFLIGLTIGYLNNHAAVSPAVRFLIAIGFIGSFSTFSTFEFETWSDLTSGAFWTGIAYAVTSLTGGLMAVAMGSAIARLIA